MNVVKTVLGLIPAIIKAVKEVEAAFPPGSGKEKLSIVLKAIESGLGKDGADVDKNVMPAVKVVVNRVVDAFNILGVFVKAQK